MKRVDEDEKGTFLHLSRYRLDEKLELKSEVSNKSLTQKLQSAFSEPSNEPTKQRLLSGELITKLMGRKSMNCH